MAGHNFNPAPWTGKVQITGHYRTAPCHVYSTNAQKFKHWIKWRKNFFRPLVCHDVAHLT